MVTTTLANTIRSRGLLALTALILVMLSACESSGPRPTSTPTDGAPLVRDLSPLDESKYINALDQLDGGDEKRARKVLASLAKKPSHRKLSP